MGKTWRPGLVLQAVYLGAGLCIGGYGCAIMILDSKSGMLAVGFDWFFAGLWLFFLLQGVFFVGLAFGKVTVEPDQIRYRNALHLPERVVDVSKVIRVDGGYAGIELLDSDGKFYHMFVVQKSNLADWMGWSTRADRLVDVIRDGVVAAGGRLVDG